MTILRSGASLFAVFSVGAVIWQKPTADAFVWDIPTTSNPFGHQQTTKRVLKIPSASSLKPHSVSCNTLILLSASSTDEDLSTEGDNSSVFPSPSSKKSRRDVLVKSVKAAATASTLMFTTTIFSGQQQQNTVAYAKSSMKPEVALENLMQARQELANGAKKYLPKGDYSGLKEYLDSNEATHINNFELYSSALLESKMLDAESKKAIGTIRTYGAGADVMIMYGGLKSELNEDPPDSSEAIKYLQRAVNSLDEVIAIVRSNDGF